MPKLRLTYYPDITQHRTPAEIHAAVEVFAKELERDLATAPATTATVETLPVVSVREQTWMLAEGECEIGLVKPSSYVYARRRNANVTPVAVALRVIDGTAGDRYFAQVYARRDTGILTLADLQARCRDQVLANRPTIAFGDPFSTSNFLVPAAHLLDQGMHPFTRFRAVEYCGGHDGAVKAVYSGRLDVGAGHDGVIVDLARQAGFEDAAAKLVRLDRVFIHSDPVAVNVSAEQAKAIAASLLKIERLPVVKTALDVLWGAVVGLGPTKHENYASVEEAINRLGIPEEDVLV